MACGGLGLRVVAEAREPMDVWFAAKPGELTLCVLPSCLLDGSACGFEGDFAAEVSAQFAIANEIKRLGVFGKTAINEAADFVEPTIA